LLLTVAVLAAPLVYLSNWLPICSDRVDPVIAVLAVAKLSRSVYDDLKVDRATRHCDIPVRQLNHRIDLSRMFLNIDCRLTVQRQPPNILYLCEPFGMLGVVIVDISTRDLLNQLLRLRNHSFPPPVVRLRPFLLLVLSI